MQGDRPGIRRALSVPEEIRLIAGAKHGDHGSFETLVDHYMGRAVAVARGYVGNREDALDMAQEAFYRVYRALDRFREGERFAPWFFKILRNTCLNFLDKRRRGKAFSIHGQTEDDTDMPLPDEAPGPCEDSEIRESQQELWKSLEKLPMKHREIILLRHFQELDYQAMADVLEVPIGTVMSRLFHARRKLKEVMLPYMEAHK